MYALSFICVEDIYKNYRNTISLKKQRKSFFKKNKKNIKNTDKIVDIFFKIVYYIQALFDRTRWLMAQ